MRRTHDKDQPRHTVAFRKQVEQWERSFRPTETALEGGLFPGILGKGMLGFKYSEFKLSEHDAAPLAGDPDIADELAQICDTPGTSRCK